MSTSKGEKNKKVYWEKIADKLEFLRTKPISLVTIFEKKMLGFQVFLLVAPDILADGTNNIGNHKKQNMKK